MVEPTRSSSIGWRGRRRIKREAQHLKREARRILRKHGARISSELEQEIRATVSELDALEKAKDFPKVRRKLERVDRLLEKHFRI